MQKSSPVGLEPTTPQLTAECSTIELSRIIPSAFAETVILFDYTLKPHTEILHLGEITPFLPSWISPSCLLVSVSSMCYHTSTLTSQPRRLQRVLILANGISHLEGLHACDAFSVLSFLTWLPCHALGSATGTPEVSPSRSSHLTTAPLKYPTPHAG